jgi:hypothetical protein
VQSTNGTELSKSSGLDLRLLQEVADLKGVDFNAIPQRTQRVLKIASFGQACPNPKSKIQNPISPLA